MGIAGRAAGWMIQANNDQMRRSAVDSQAPNPRDPNRFPWVGRMVGNWEDIRTEWDEFHQAGGQLPHLRDLLDEDQGSDGPWKAGLLVSKGKAATRLAERFPSTVEQTLEVPGIWSALWSVLPPGSELPEHHGPNAGVLRFHLGVACPVNSALRVNSRVVPYQDRRAILFDDTAPHEAWNRGPTDRVTLFLEVLRPASRHTNLLNGATQRMLALDQRYRCAPARADEWDAALNHSLP